ncbi:IS1634 family transposase ISMyca1 [subsurface metagenome]
MYVDIIPNRNSPPAILLRESWREGKKTYKKTVANISHWPMEQVQMLKRVLKGEKLIPAEDAFVIKESWPHGHVEAILGTIRKIGLERTIASQPSRQRDLVVAMIAEQILHHDSKLADTRNWHSTTLAQELGVEDADENDLYAALDWLLARQKRIEKKLAKLHFAEGSYAFYDVTSSYYEGHTCSLARWGNNRDKKKGRKVIVYGTLAEQEGRPVAVDVFAGNTGDPKTIPDQVAKLRQDFGLKRLVLVGDRGLLTQTQIDYLRKYPGLGWISALRSKSIRELVEKGSLGISLFDTQNLAEIHSPDFPGERLIACYNPLMAEERNRKRRELLEVTEALLRKIEREVDRRTKKLLKKDEIGLKVGKVINKFKMAKHFDVTIEDSSLEWQRREEKIRQEEMLDGIYIIRTSEPQESISAEQTVKQYKNLSLVEWIYRTVKGLDILIRPIRHRAANRVRAHIFFCMLAYYVVWHMRKALAPLLFEDEELDMQRKTRDPVAKAEPSESAKRKKVTLTTSEGFKVHSFTTLLKALGKRCKHRCYVRGGDPEATFPQLTEPNALQQRAFELLGLMHPVN